MAHMKTPQYRSNLQQLLEQEKVRADAAFGTLLTSLDAPCHFCDVLQLCPPPVSSPVLSAPFSSVQQKHRDLSGQAEQLHSVCQAHKDKIKGLFQAKLDEVRVLPLYCTVVSQSILCVSLLHNKRRSQKNLRQLLICGYVIGFNSLDLWPCF